MSSAVQTAGAAYPREREADVVLRDGSTIHLRPVREGDERTLRDFYSGLSSESKFFRFFSGGVNLDMVVRRMMEVDYRTRYGLVATAGPEGQIVAHGFYGATPSGPAEVAFAVADALQGRGVATIMLGHLAQAAQAAGITTFSAEVMFSNSKMARVFQESGFPVRRVLEAGTIHYEFPTALSPEAVARFEGREREAAVAALRSVLHPSAVAVIGASRSASSIGGRVFRNLLDGDFEGPVYPVNRTASVVQSVAAYPTVGALPARAEMAVIAVPAVDVLEVARECAAAGVKSLVVVSSGFAETGDEGRERQRQLLAVCRESGMRLVGPNCLGVLNAAPSVRLNATFATSLPPPGGVGLMSQSGALGIAAVEFACARGMGISSFISVGNKADLSGNDVLQYWEEDAQTSVCMLYLESFGNPRKFARIARRVARSKPIVVVKSGRTPAGSRATSSHTGALLADSDVTVDALFAQAGVIRTETVSELLDVASLLAGQPLPAGPRVGIITNAGGPGILCADILQAGGLEVPVLSAGLQATLAGLLPAIASSGNPVDMTAAGSALQYEGALEAIANSGEVDAVIAVFIPPMLTRGEDVANALKAVELPPTIPLLAVFMASGGPPAALNEGRVIPNFAFPEEAARALVHASGYARWRREPEGTIPTFADLGRAEADDLLTRRLEAGAGWLEPADLEALLAFYRIPMVESRIAASAAEAGRRARELGTEVALKAIAPGLIHKTEAGAVRLGLRGASAVRREASAMARRLRAQGLAPTGFLVQEMVPAGVEMLVGVVHDPHFGPVIACGGGGVQAELIKDVAVRITPLTDRDAAAMPRSLATYPLLQGYRGSPRADVASLERLLLRVSALVEDHPELAEMDLNPVVVGPGGAMVVDARARLALPPPEPPLAAR
ncbi:MAG TPA: GNAT family N-acetyltransferase [Candidatus Dormibacteraeota bacterium]|nr:GNAT family N-acetyltransferase [Candidatus Dormibacteraeota bacterium]